MEKNDMKLCVDCKHCTNPLFSFDGLECSFFKKLVLETDPVTGKIKKEESGHFDSCSVERRRTYSDSCGPSAKNFEKASPRKAFLNRVPWSVKCISLCLSVCVIIAVSVL